MTEEPEELIDYEKDERDDYYGSSGCITGKDARNPQYDPESV